MGGIFLQLYMKNNKKLKKKVFLSKKQFDLADNK